MAVVSRNLRAPGLGTMLELGNPVAVENARLTRISPLVLGPG